MAIKMSPEEISTFKANLEILMPYVDHDLINLLAKGIYTSSNFSYEIKTGLEATVEINGIQMYSRHNVLRECQMLCAHLPLPKLHVAKRAGHLLQDAIEDKLYPNPKRRQLREQKLEQWRKQSAENEHVLMSAPPPKVVNTSGFPKISCGLEITNAADDAFAHEHVPLPQVTIYGIGAAHVVEYIHSLYPTLDINVVILNPEITAIMLCLDQEMGKRLAHPHVNVYMGDDNTPLMNNAVYLVPELVLLPNFNSRLKQAILHQMERDYVRCSTRKHRHNLLSLATRYTLPYCMHANQLKNDTFSPCKEIALVFPGPSLADTFRRLQDLKKKNVRIIASDLTLAFLEEKGFAPDIIVCHDLGPYKFASSRNKPFQQRIFLNPELYQNSALLVTSKTHLLIASKFTGKTYLIYTGDLKRRGVEMQEGAMIDLDITSSVSSMMVSLALKQQATRIYLFGLDTISKIDSYHAGFTDSTEAMLLARNHAVDVVTSNDNRLRRAVHCYTSYRLHIEDVIAANRNVDFVNCSPYGAVIKGCSLDDFKALQEDMEEGAEDVDYGNN